MTYKSLQTIASRLAWCWFSRFQSFPGSDDPFQKKKHGSLIPLGFQPKGWTLTFYSYKIVIPTPNPNMALKKKSRPDSDMMAQFGGTWFPYFPSTFNNNWTQNSPKTWRFGSILFSGSPPRWTLPAEQGSPFSPCCQPKNPTYGWWFRNPKQPVEIW